MDIPTVETFIADLFCYIDIAKKCETRFYPLIEARDEKGTEANATIHAEATKVIEKILSILPHYGIGYKEIISLLNADAEIAKEIEKNNDTELALDVLIVKYHIADKHYHALTNALTGTMNSAESMMLNVKEKIRQMMEDEQK